MNHSIDLALHSYSLRLHYLYEADYDVFRFLDDAQSLGFTGVNISLSGPDNDRLPPNRHLSGSGQHHIEAVAEELRARDLSVEIDTDRTDVVTLRHALSVANTLDARVVRTFTHHSPGPGLVADTQADLVEIAPEAESADVVVALENHEEFTSEELAGLVENVDSPAVRLLFDYGNSLPVLEEPHDALGVMQPWVVACHMKDGVMIDPVHTPEGLPSMIGVPLGQGSIDTAGLTRRLVSGGLYRICLQNVWGYHVPLSRLRPVDLEDPRLGKGTFTYETLPFPGSRILFQPERNLDAPELVAAERNALVHSTTTAHRISTELRREQQP